MYVVTGKRGNKTFSHLQLLAFSLPPPINEMNMRNGNVRWTTHCPNFYCDNHEHADGLERVTGRRGMNVRGIYVATGMSSGDEFGGMSWRSQILKIHRTESTATPDPAGNSVSAARRPCRHPQVCAAGPVSLFANSVHTAYIPYTYR